MDHALENDRLTFVASNYSATGEGTTISLLITRAYPRSEDYDDDFRNVKTTAEQRALREFAEKFGQWTSSGAKVHERYNFLQLYQAYLPPIVLNLMDSDAGNFNWHSEFHVNYS